MKMKYLASKVCCLLSVCFFCWFEARSVSWVDWVTNSHTLSRLSISLILRLDCQPRFTNTGYLRTVCFHYHDCVLICTLFKNDRFLRVNTILFLKNLKNSSKIAWHLWSVCLSSGAQERYRKLQSMNKVVFSWLVNISTECWTQDSRF